jgi:spore germination cell wall hydrolase CwlJ-like protein
MSDNDSWDEVKVPNTEQKEVEFEVEGEEEKAAPEVESKPEVEAEPQKKENKEPELEGIETKGAEKRIRQLIRQRKERDEYIANLIQEKKELHNILKTKNMEVNEVNKLSLDASEKQLTDKLDLARSVYMEAFEEGDKERVLKAQEMLNEAQNDLKQVSTAKIRYENQPEPAPVQQQPVYQPQAQPENDPKAEEWAAKNSWFGQDNVKTAAALAIDAELKGEGYDPRDEEFYQEIDNRIKKAFSPDVGETEERVQESSSTPAQVVSGASRLSPSSSNKVKLSKEDVRLAQKWNIPLEQYAAEKLKVDDAEGNYTNIT